MSDYIQMTLKDRRRIYIFLEKKLGVNEIAKKLGRHKSTIYRELKRNKERQSLITG